MKKTTTLSRPDRKVTEFFSKKPKAEPRPDQPIYAISSSSERQSVISISSDDVPVPPKMLQPASGASSRVRSNNPPSWGDARSTAKYVSSSPRTASTRPLAEYVASSSSGTSRSRSNDVQTASKPSSKKQSNNAKKRKQPPINLISSEESDDPVFPAIRVAPSSKRAQSSVPSAQFQPSIPRTHSQPDITASSIAPVPLAPRQNVLSTPQRSPRKPDRAIHSPAKRSAPSANPATPKYHEPSPPKRARYSSISALDKRSFSAPDCDADDESEHEPTAPSACAESLSSSRPDETDYHADGGPMDVDAPTAPSFRPTRDGDADDENDGAKAPHKQPTRKTTPQGDEQEVLPSSQQDEIELHIDDIPMDIDQLSTPARSAPRVPDPVSPSKARTDGIIARIKAKAEADVAAQLQEERRRASLGLLSDEVASDLSSLSSIESDDDDDLELELSAFGKGNGPANPPTANSGLSTSSLRMRSQTPGGGIRRSTRHGDAPAPNYAKKLELFRDDTPLPLPLNQKGKENDDNAKGKGKAKAAFACPLDVLLKDTERQGARKAHAETKRKNRDARDSSPALSVVSNHQSGAFETPSRRVRAETEGPGSDVFSVADSDVFGGDVLMGDAEREELLGKKGAEAVGRILAVDRKKRGRVEKKDEGGILFWDVSVESGEDVIPELVVDEQSVFFLKTLCNAMHRGDYFTASLLLDSGALATVPLTTELLEWLFSTAMTTAHPQLSKSAYRAVLLLHRVNSTKDVMGRVRLNSSVFLRALFKFGVSGPVVDVLGAEAGRDVSVVSVSREVRVEMVCRLIAMIEILGRSRAIEPTAIPTVVSTLLLLSLDPSAVPELQQSVVSAIECVLTSPTLTRTVETNVCKSILHATKSLSFTPGHQAQLLSLLSGCSPSSGCVRRWTAWAILGGDLQSTQACDDVPPLEVLANVFAKSPAGGVGLEVTRDTDYEVLGSRVDILSVAMTDVDAYVRQERTARGTVVSTGSGSSLEIICKALERMNGKIVDTRAAHLDRTRTKDAINRLHKRLVYQRHATLEILRGSAGRMDRFVTKKAPNSKSKSKPKPVKPQIEDQLS